MDGSDIRDLQKLIGYTFRDESLILQALTHSSFCNEQLIGRCGDSNSWVMPFLKV